MPTSSGLAALESEFEIKVEIIAATSLHRSEEHIDWFHRAEHEQPETATAAVTVADLEDGAKGGSGRAKKAARSKASPEPTTPVADEREPAKPKRRRRGGRRRKKNAAGSTEAKDNSISC